MNKLILIIPICVICLSMGFAVSDAQEKTTAQTLSSHNKISLGSKTLAYPAPVWVIGSYDNEGAANMMTASWAGICCSVPPCLTISLRKATYTYGNIMQHRAYTVNIPSQQYLEQTDFFGMVSGRDVDKLAATGLTATAGEFVNAPYIAEFPIVIECKVIETLDLGLHTLFIGQIVDVKADPAILNESGTPDMDKLNTFIYAPGSSKYYTVGSHAGNAFSAGSTFKQD